MATSSHVQSEVKTRQSTTLSWSSKGQQTWMLTVGKPSGLLKDVAGNELPTLLVFQEETHTGVEKGLP